MKPDPSPVVVSSWTTAGLIALAAAAAGSRPWSSVGGGTVDVDRAVDWAGRVVDEATVERAAVEAGASSSKTVLPTAIPPPSSPRATATAARRRPAHPRPGEGAGCGVWLSGPPACGGRGGAGGGPWGGSRGGVSGSWVVSEALDRQSSPGRYGWSISGGTRPGSVFHWLTVGTVPSPGESQAKH